MESVPSSYHTFYEKKFEMSIEEFIAICQQVAEGD
jgi:hypothetical protein